MMFCLLCELELELHAEDLWFHARICLSSYLDTIMITATTSASAIQAPEHEISHKKNVPKFHITKSFDDQ